MAKAAVHARPLLALALAAGALLVPARAFCDGDKPPSARRAYAPAPCVGGARVGQVVAVAGAAYAMAPGQPPRHLGCDDALRACEEIVTAPGASLAFLSGDVLVRVGGDARVALAGAAAAPDLFVRRGALRSTDGRSAGAAPVRLGSRDLVASASGADAELDTGTDDDPSRLCAYAGSAAVELSASSRTLHAGTCFAAQGGGVVSFAAGEPALGLEAAGFCVFEVALDALGPDDVAVPPPDDLPREPCDVPGSGCSGHSDDPDPVPGCDPPGVQCGG